MNSSVLIVYCENDIPTRYASYWSRLIGKEARLAGHEVRDLSGFYVTSYGLLTAMEQYQPDFVVLAGHGSATVFTGAGLQEVLIACQNDQMMAGSQCMFISCLTGISLVPSMVKKGAEVVSGFTAEFIWMVDASENPATDVYAKSFERTLVESAKMVLRGGTWQQWYSTFRRVSDEEIAKWGYSDDPLANSVIFCLRSNRNSVVVSGAGSMMYGEGGGLLLPALAALALIKM